MCRTGQQNEYCRSSLATSSPRLCLEPKGIWDIGSPGAGPSPFESSSGYQPGLLPKICMRLLRVQFRGPSRSRVGGVGVRAEPRGKKATLAPEAGAVSTFSSAFKKRWKLDLSRRRPRPASTDGRTVRPRWLALRCAVSGSQQQVNGPGRGAPRTGGRGAL